MKAQLQALEQLAAGNPLLVAVAVGAAVFLVLEFHRGSKFDSDVGVLRSAVASIAAVVLLVAASVALGYL